jgi:alpha-1,6-mannosyltransferase
MNLPSMLDTGVPRRLVVGGLVGTTLLAFGGMGAGAVPKKGKDAIAQFLHVEWLQEHDSTYFACTVLALLGVGLLLTSWWQLRGLLATLQPRSLVLVAAIWSLPLLVAPPLFSRDVYAYAGQGNLILNHIDPYTYGPGDYSPTDKWALRVDGVWRFQPSPYGPVWLWLASRIVLLSQDHMVPALIMLRLLAVAGLMLIAWGLPRLARAHGVPPQRALWLGLANPFVLIHGVGGAHNDALMIGLLIAGLAVAGVDPSRRRLVIAAALIATAALVKLPAVAALGFLPMLRPTWRGRISAAFLAGFTALASGVVLTWATGLGYGWLHTLDAGSARLSIWSPTTGIGVAMGQLLRAMGLVDTPETVVRVVLAVALALGGIVALVLLLRSHRNGPLRALGLSLVAVVALAPVVQPWYLLWGLVLLAAVGGERVTLALSALSLALCLSLLPDGVSLLRPPLYGVPLLLAVAIAALEVRRATRRVLEPV